MYLCWPSASTFLCWNNSSIPKIWQPMLQWGWYSLESLLTVQSQVRKKIRPVSKILLLHKSNQTLQWFGRSKLGAWHVTDVFFRPSPLQTLILIDDTYHSPDGTLKDIYCLCLTREAVDSGGIRLITQILSFKSSMVVYLFFNMSGSAQASAFRGSHCVNISTRFCYPFRPSNLWQILNLTQWVAWPPCFHRLKQTHALWNIFYTWIYQPTYGLRRMAVRSLLCDNPSSLWSINFHFSSVLHHRSAFPRTMIAASSLWICLTRLSHRHFFKCETNNHIFLEIARSTVGDVLWMVLSRGWFTHFQASYLLATHSKPTETPDVYNTSSISYHRELATLLHTELRYCERSLTSAISYKSYSQNLS